MRGILTRGFVLTLAALALGCSDSPTDVTTPPVDPGPRTGPAPSAPVDQFAVAPGTASLHAGRALQLSASALRGGVESEVAAGDVLWESSDEAIATVETDGLVRGLRPGEVEIRALWETNRALVRINVLKAEAPPQDPSCRKGICL
jgi:Bacterial Ig-like domain (group 2)